MTRILIVFTFFFTSPLFSQNDSNLVKWEKVFLSKHLIPTDSSNSHFFGYEISGNGYLARRFPRKTPPPEKRITVKYNVSLQKKGNPIEVNDTIFYYRKDKLLVLEIYKNGKNQKSIHYKRKRNIKGFFDYTNKYNNQEGSFLVQYDSGKNGQTWYYRWSKEFSWRRYHLNGKPNR
jgi:hypothetical protein